MLSLILSAFLGVTASCTGHCPNGVSATITITATIVAANQMAINMEPTDVHGVQIASVEAISTGHEDAYSRTERYIIFDNDPFAPNKEPVMFAMSDVGVHAEVKNEEYFVMMWPSGRELPSKRELVAMRNEVLGVHNATALAMYKAPYFNGKNTSMTRKRR